MIKTILICIRLLIGNAFKVNTTNEARLNRKTDGIIAFFCIKAYAHRVPDKKIAMYCDQSMNDEIKNPGIEGFIQTITGMKINGKSPR